MITSYSPVVPSLNVTVFPSMLVRIGLSKTSFGQSGYANCVGLRWVMWAYSAPNFQHWIKLSIEHSTVWKYLKGDIFSRVTSTNTENSLTFVQFAINEVMSMNVFSFERLFALERGIMWHRKVTSCDCDIIENFIKNLLKESLYRKLALNTQLPVHLIWEITDEWIKLKFIVPTRLRRAWPTYRGQGQGHACHGQTSGVANLKSKSVAN